MSCCNNPNLVQSACADVCTNCGYYQSYRGDCESGQDDDNIFEEDDYET